MPMQIYTYIQADTDTQWIAVHKDEMNAEHLPDDGFLRALISAESEAEKEKTIRLEDTNGTNTHMKDILNKIVVYKLF